MVVDSVCNVTDYTHKSLKEVDDMAPQFGMPSEMQARFAQSGARLVGNTPDQFAAMVVVERARWEKIIRAAGIKAQ